MPSLDTRIFRAIDARIVQRSMDSLVISAQSWETVETADILLQEDLLIDGRTFLTSAYKNFLSQRVFPRPPGSYEVVQAAIFSEKTFISILKSAGIERSQGDDMHKAFLMFVGAALGELSEDTLVAWFALTFGPLITAAEEAYTEYYDLPGMSRRAKRAAGSDLDGPHIRKIRRNFDRCAAPLKCIREKQPIIYSKPQAHRNGRVTIKSSSMLRSSSLNRPGFMSQIKSAVKTFVTKNVPEFLHYSFFGPPLVLPPGTFTAHTNLALQSFNFSVPSASTFAPRLDFVPVRLPAPSQPLEADADLFREIRETYALLQAMSTLPPVPLTSASTLLPSGPTSFGLPCRAPPSGTYLLQYREPRIQD
ncbi:hypothetical protein MVEN_01795700 [Mycena venus]|uniref:Uncharacterized protein n=1 Tax=Mycena venus TaxID=2733690 RepID=A0A8H7CLG4_9AGAR|nr:hypothetical protein MVEN_01795700 [Mycena venus]